MLTTDLYRIINKYANSFNLYKVIPSINKQECIFILALCNENDSTEGAIHGLSTKYSLLNFMHVATNKYPINSIKITRPIKYPFILSIPNIISLTMSGCNLTGLPEMNMPHLRYLSFCKNRIRVLPPFNLPKLTFMSAFSNSLTMIPDFNLPKLEELHISKNRSIVPDFNYLPNLKYITCERELAFSKCTKLQKINCHPVSYGVLSGISCYRTKVSNDHATNRNL